MFSWLDKMEECDTSVFKPIDWDDISKAERNLLTVTVCLFQEMWFAAYRFIRSFGRLSLTEKREPQEHYVQVNVIADSCMYDWPYEPIVQSVWSYLLPLPCASRCECSALSRIEYTVVRLAVAAPSWNDSETEIGQLSLPVNSRQLQAGKSFVRAIRLSLLLYLRYHWIVFQRTHCICMWFCLSFGFCSV